MSKKAITPLISTILLLSFAIGLGTLVMSWGNSEQHSKLSCADTDISITELDSSMQICLEGNELKAVIENNGNSQINGIQMVILTSDSVMTKEFEADINPREYKHMTFPMGISDISKILKIRFIPIVANDACITKRAEIERVGECSGP